MMTDLTRRAFLRLAAGNTLALAAGTSGFAAQFPANWISEPLPAEYNIKAVELIRYATTCRECPAGCGMHVRHSNGRALKAEGNPAHPVNLGGLCPRGQSALQGLYDPDRLRTPRRHPTGKGANQVGMNAESTWPQALAAIGERLQSGKGKMVVLSSLETGPLARIMADFAANFDGELLLYEPFDYRAQREVMRSATGEPIIPWHSLDRCKSIISFGADFLESWVSNVQFTHMFTEMHRYRPEHPMGSFAYLGPRLSMTGASADDFHLVPAHALADVAMTVLKVIAENNLVRSNILDYQALTREFKPKNLPLRDAAGTVGKLAAEFGGDGGSAALAGPASGGGAAAERLARAVFHLNKAAGNYGDTIDPGRVHALSRTGYADQVAASLAGLGEEDILIVHHANPAYTMSAMPAVAEALARVGLVVSLTQMVDETALLSDWVLPVDNPLESWGEYSPWTGIDSFLQPTMKRLWDSRSAGDIFPSLADIGGRPLQRSGDSDQDLTFASWLRADWRDRYGRWESGRERLLLQRGFYQSDEKRKNSEPESEETPAEKIRAGAVEKKTGKQMGAAAKMQPDQAALWLWPSIFHFDGRTANRSWLLENPQPVSYIAWGSWIEIHPLKADSLGIGEGDAVVVARDSTTLTAPARITSEIEQNSVGLALGLGHQALGHNAAGLGVNGFALLDAAGESDHFFPTVTLAKAAAGERAICLTSSRDQHHRHIIRWEKKGKITGKQGEGHIDLPLTEGFSKKNDIYEGHKHAGHRWAMVIDLHRCIGCGACAVACYAENNIPVVGLESTREGREMAWMKVIPYDHPEKKGKVGFIPLPCQHCDQAPCEPVCPVFASVHTEDGLNAQVYNRCIGTRYCSQNCPYKVRRFNWLNTTWTPPLEWQLNPDVTVRSRGVMEKCTFCVQRIRRAEYRAKRENRPIRDGEIQPACVQSCPAKVFAFGDLHDRDSEVTKLFREDPRGYQLLHELNTKTAVLYLKKVERG